MKLMNLGVAIMPIKEETKQIGQVIVPDNVTVTRNHNEGIVVATGNGTKERPMEVIIGERVMYKKGDYPKSESCDVVSLDDILYVVANERAD